MHGTNLHKGLAGLLTLGVLAVVFLGFQTDQPATSAPQAEPAPRKPRARANRFRCPKT